MRKSRGPDDLVDQRRRLDGFLTPGVGCQQPLPGLGQFVLIVGVDGQQGFTIVDIITDFESQDHPHGVVNGVTLLGPASP